MKEIKKPSDDRYWIAYDSNTGDMFKGVTKPNQTTTTGMQTFIISVTQSSHLSAQKGVFEDTYEDLVTPVPKNKFFYVPVKEEYAFIFSKLLYNIVKPNKKGVFSGIIDHPSDNTLALVQFYKNETIYISEEFDTNLLFDVYKNVFDIEDFEIEEVITILNANKNKKLKIRDYIIPSSQQMFILEENDIDLTSKNKNKK